MDAATAGGTVGIAIAIITGLFGLAQILLTNRKERARRRADADDLAERLAVRDKNEIEYLRAAVAERDQTIDQKDVEIARLNRLLARGRNDRS